MSSLWNRTKRCLAAVGLLSTLALLGLAAVTSHAQIQVEDAAGAASAASAATPVVIDQPGEGPVTQPQGKAYAAPTKLNPKVARVVLYRPVQGGAKGVAHLEVNGKYHTSLQSGGYSEVCVLPSPFTLSANMVEADDAADTGPKTSLSLETRAQQSIYMRVNDNGDNKATITPVVDEVAKAELQQTRRQVHVATRVPDLPECVEAEDQYAERATATQDNVLPSDDLFGFGKSDIQGISAKGRVMLDQLIAKIQAEHPGLDKAQIRVVGHADPIGNPQANLRLSEARAQAIRSYLVNTGLNAQRISAEGLGDTQPVVATCGKTNTPDNIACNKPNRRVVVVVQTLGR